MIAFGVPCMYVSGTVSPRSRLFLLRQLDANPQSTAFVSNMADRANLKHTFERVPKEPARRIHVENYLDEHRGEFAIIYVNSKFKARELAAALRLRRHKAMAYFSYDKEDYEKGGGEETSGLRTSNWGTGTLSPHGNFQRGCLPLA